MSKNIVAFDVETTGLDHATDHIIQLAAVKFDSEFRELDTYCVYVKPEGDFEIAEGAFEKHGLTKEFIIENGYASHRVMNEFKDFCEDCDMLSYNGNSFDIKFIVKEMRAACLEFSLDRVFYDSLALEAKINPRTLDFIYKKYTGNELDNAHNALYDVKATIDIFRHQVENFHDQGISIDDIMGFEESQIFDVDGMFKKDGDEIIFAKGKYRGVEFMEVCKGDAGYINWYMKNSDFNNHTKKILKEYYAQHRSTSK